MSPHYFYSVVDSVSKSVLGSPVLIYIDDCCGHKIDAAAFDVIEELLAAMFKSCKFVIEACFVIEVALRLCKCAMILTVQNLRLVTPKGTTMKGRLKCAPSY